MNHDYPVQILGTVYAAYQKRGQVKNKHIRKDKDVKKIISISLALIAGLSTCGISVFAESKEPGFTEKAVPVLRDSLDSSETATLRYYEDLPDIPYKSVTDFYNQFYLVGTEITEGMTFSNDGSELTRELCDFYH